MNLLTYKEPELTIAVLDFQKPEAARLCLESIKRHVKFPVKVTYLHNGEADYPAAFLKEGLIDTLIMPRTNGGLGLGTRDLMAAVFSPYVIYLQNDQYIARDLGQTEFEDLKDLLDQMDRDGYVVKSISLAGPVCDTQEERHIYSERAYIMRTDFYRKMEHNLPLTHGGAGPWAHVMWREEQIQKYYRDYDYLHFTDWPRLVQDNGRTAERQNPDGSRWVHFPDTKQLWLVSGPVKQKYVYPKFDENEWNFVIDTQSWPPGSIPENEKQHSFHVWN